MKLLLAIVLIILTCGAPIRAGVQTSTKRPFLMGFSSWPYGATPKAVNDTYRFIGANADLILEHIEEGVPWSCALNKTPYPKSFVDKMEGRRGSRPKGVKLLLSLTALNTGRSGLADDIGVSGTQPVPAPLQGKKFNDPIIFRAYLDYCIWMVDLFKPDYLLTGIEANELLNNNPNEWSNYQTFSRGIQKELRIRYPSLPIAESVTLHKLLDKSNRSLPDYAAKIKEFASRHDFFAVSFYPFFLGLHSKREFSEALEQLSKFSDKRIGITETGHPAKPIVIKTYHLNLPSSPAEQDDYVRALLDQAQSHRYLFVTYWLWKDFDDLWNTFPDASKDLARLWRDTGLVDENDGLRPAYSSWKAAFSKPHE